MSVKSPKSNRVIDKGIPISDGTAVKPGSSTAKRNTKPKLRGSRPNSKRVSSEQNLSLVIESLPHAIVLVDARGEIVLVNVQTEKYFGYKRDELIGQNIEVLIPERFRRMHFHHLADFMAGPVARPLDVGRDLFGLRKDGSEFPAEIGLSPIEGGQRTMVIASIVDITERKRMEEALRLSEDKFSQAFRISPDAINISRLSDGMYLEINQGFIQLTGYTSEDVRGKTSTDIHIWADPNDRLRLVKELREHGVVENLEARFRFKDGQVKTGLVSAKIIEINHEPCILSISRDISERKRMEDALRYSETNLAEAQRISHLGSWNWNLAGNKIHCSEEMFRIAGSLPSESELTQDTFVKFIHPEDAGMFLQEILRETLDPSLLNIEHRIIRPNGEIRNVLSHIKVYRDENGKPLRILGSTQDITEQKLTQALQDAVYEITSAAEITESLDELYPRIHQIISSVMPAGNFFIMLYDEKKNTLQFPYFRDEADEPYIGELEPGKGLTAYVLRTGKSLLCTQAVHDELERQGAVKLLGKPSAVWLGVPLIVNSNTIGVMVVQHYTDASAYGEREQHMLEFVSSQVANAIARKRAQEALKKSEENYRSIVDNAVDAITQTTPEGKYLSANPAAAQMLGYNSPEELIAETYNIATQFYVKPDRRQEFMDLMEKDGFVKGFESEVFRKDGSTTWVSENSHVVRDEQGAILYYEGTAVDIADRKRSEEKIQQQMERLAALTAIDHAISSSFDMQFSLSVLLLHVAKQLKADAADIFLFNPNLNVLEYFVGRGFRTRSVETAKLHLGESLSDRLVIERQVVLVPNMARSNLIASRAKMLEAESFVEYCGIPVVVKGKIKGVLEIFHRSQLEMDQEWLDFLHTLAGQAAIAIDNFQLFNGLQRSNDELRLAYDTTIEGWSRALDLRDKETEGHTQRVTQMTLKLARAAGIGEDELVHIQRGALLHDIGKLGVPDDVLLKAGELTESDRKIMHQHPRYAYELLSPIEYLRPALDIPYCHHEKWDGTGYPRGLKGEQIPLPARLFAVVDVWDALRADRPYRASWPKEKVSEYIRSLAGTHFDPRAVELFFEVFGG